MEGASGYSDSQSFDSGFASTSFNEEAVSNFPVREEKGV
jgi:hypothetical protein